MKDFTAVSDHRCCNILFRHIGFPNVMFIHKSAVSSSAFQWGLSFVFPLSHHYPCFPCISIALRASLASSLSHTTNLHLPLTLTVCPIINKEKKSSAPRDYSTIPHWVCSSCLVHISLITHPHDDSSILSSVFPFLRTTEQQNFCTPDLIPSAMQFQLQSSHMVCLQPSALNLIFPLIQDVN